VIVLTIPGRLVTIEDVDDVDGGCIGARADDEEKTDL